MEGFSCVDAVCFRLFARWREKKVGWPRRGTSQPARWELAVANLVYKLRRQKLKTNLRIT
jgi:hypothetical protein